MSVLLSTRKFSTTSPLFVAPASLPSPVRLLDGLAGEMSMAELVRAYSVTEVDIRPLFLPVV